MAEFTSDLRHVAGADNVVADCLSRPPVELSISRDGSTGASSAVAVAAGVMAAPPLPAVVPSTPSHPTVEAPSSTVVAAVVPATQQGPIRWEELARDQLTCQETQGLLTSNTGLLVLVETVVYQGASCGATPLQGPSGHWCRSHRGEPSSSRCTSSPTLAGAPRGGWWLPALSGQVWHQIWWPGARSVQPATAPR